MRTLENLLSCLKDVFAGLPDKRRGPDCTYTMADIGMAAFSPFYMQCPSFLAYQEALEVGHGRSNCQTLFGMTTIPTANHIREQLDGKNPSAFDGVFLKALAIADTGNGLAKFRRLNGRILVALDGTEHFSSRKIKCTCCSKRQRSDGGTEFFHSFLGATVVAPGHNQVLPLPPEFVTPQDGAEKQDCERMAVKRWLAKHGVSLQAFRPVYLGDDLFACQPVAEAIKAADGSFIFTCKPSSHKTISEYIDGAELTAHQETIRQPGKKTTVVYRFINEIPLRNTKDAMMVNWFSVEMFNAKGKLTYRNSFITDIPVSADNVAELAACGRARWKIENETFNVLKTGGYNLEHNFGHGKKSLSNLLVVLNLLAFTFHTVALISALAWRTAVAARGASYRFFEHLRTITAYIVFPDWDALLTTIADPKARPP